MSSIYDRQVAISLKNASKTHGRQFQGWGTSLCWWANRLGYSDKLAQQAADLFFGEDGLRLNIIRYNIGGGDDPAHRHITRTDSKMPGWLVYDRKTGGCRYDYNADRRQLNVLRRAVQAAGKATFVEVFSNSPPFFMTKSGCSSGNADAAQDNLRPEYMAEFAGYLAHVAKFINDEMGIRVGSVSPMNEPNTDFWRANSEKQEGCHFDAGQAQSALLVETAKAFAACGLHEVEIVGSDETSPQKQLLACGAYSEEARSVLRRISTHTYDTTCMEELGDWVKAQGINLWMSEVDGDKTAGENAGEMGAAIWLGEKIISDIGALSPSAWVLWQVIDSHISAQGMDGNTDRGMVDICGGFWGTAVADHDHERIILTQKYFAFGQFTRYIRPGDTLIHCGEDVLAAYSREAEKLVIVAINPHAANRRCRFALSHMKTGAATVRAIRTSGGLQDGESWAELDGIPAREDGFTAELLGNSITTFIISSVTAEDAQEPEKPPVRCRE